MRIRDWSSDVCSSDLLDLIYLFSGDFTGESDGRRPLGATQYYNRLVQRISNAMSVQTASGPLYEVDTRLRPSGAQGLLAVSFDSFERYQKEAAWTWEHLALTRARPVYGSAASRSALKSTRSEEHTSALQSLMRISYAVFCLKKTTKTK